MSDRFLLSRLPADLKTPCYIFDPQVVLSRLQHLREALGGGVVVSIKANPLLDLFVRCCHAFTDGVEVASIGELNLVIGRLAAPRFVNTPAMDIDLMSAAHASRSTIILDNPAQVSAYIARFSHAPDRARLMIRVNVGSLLGGKMGTRYSDQFGMDPATLLESAKRLTTSGFTLSGLAMFGGSNSFADLSLPIAAAAGPLVADVERTIGARLEILNLGGGLPADWEMLDLPFVAYRKALSQLPDHLTVLHETGRALFAAAGVFAVKLLSIKAIDEKPMGVCDGGIAHCFALAQTESIIKRPRQAILLKHEKEEISEASTPLQLYGNSCSRADHIGELKDVAAAEGDILVFENCGAYHSYSPTGFLNLKPASHFVIS